MRTREEISTMLATKFKAESNRLKSWGTKTDDKVALSFAMSVVDFVIALMCESRNRELNRISKKFNGFHFDWSYKNHKPLKEFSNSLDSPIRDALKDYLQERLKATKNMAKVLENYAVANESKRVWKHKSEHKHKHRRHK